MEYKYLFTPFKVGSVTLKNRIFSAAIGTGYTENGLVSERTVEYQKARAKGGVGLIVTEGMIISLAAKPAYKINSPVIFEEKALPGLSQLAEAVHPYGTKIFAQICHLGRQSDSGFSRHPLSAPSPIPCPAMREMPKEMEVEEIKEVVKEFANTARLVKKAGLDGVEIHGASGHLITQFMSPWTNKRTDEYGGSFENRMRFPLEVIDAIREAVGDDFVVGIRIPGDELVPGGNTLEDMKRIAQSLEASGKIDYISLGHAPYAGHFATGLGMHIPLGFWNVQAAQLKEAVDLPVMTSLRINDPVQAEKILADGIADLVGMARALIADPDMPNKARESRLEEIRYCIACDQGCVARIAEGKPMSCLQNAVVGLEKEIGTLETARPKKRVLVAGGGPGGMEVARVARLRGHEVVIYEKNNELGGQVNIAVKVPGRNEFGGCTRYLVKQMEILGVKVNLGTEVTPELVEREAFDVVVVATGSTPDKPSIPGVDQENVVTVWDVLQEKVKIGEKVVVADGGEAHWQCLSVAEYLAEKGKKVEIITPLPFVGMGIASTMNLVAYCRRVKSKGVVFNSDTALKEISGNTVVVIDTHTYMEKRIEKVDTIVMAMFNQANNQLYRSLKGKVKELYAVGDCVAPRKAIDAIYEGYNVGRTI